MLMAREMLPVQMCFAAMRAVSFWEGVVVVGSVTELLLLCNIEELCSVWNSPRKKEIKREKMRASIWSPVNLVVVQPSIQSGIKNVIFRAQSIVVGLLPALEIRVAMMAYASARAWRIAVVRGS